MLSKTDIEKIKQKLTLELNSIIDSINFKEDEIDGSGDEIDRIQGNFVASMQETISSRKIEKANKIEYLLYKIETNCYGVCQECEEEISFKRLEVNPYTTYCIECAEKSEKANQENKKSKFRR